MIRILAIETCTDVLSIGIYENQLLIASQEYLYPKLHAKLITVSIQQLLQNIDLTPEDISAVAVSGGPGSYTGIRVGVAAAKGLCFALDIPLISIPTLYSLACQVSVLANATHSFICPMLDARREEVYTSLYHCNLSGVFENEAHVLHSHWLSEIREQYEIENNIILIGDGAHKAQFILEKDKRNIFLPDVHSASRGLGNYLMNNFEKQIFENLYDFEPFYLKEVMIRAQK